MTELWLNFTDEEGYPKRVLVERDSFVIGRHSDNDLCISDNRLSRQHLLIERANDEFIASDCGSSNGTQLNFDELFESETLRDGDFLNLGGVEIRVEIISVYQEESFAPAAQETAPTVSAVNVPQKNVQSVPDSFGGVSSNFFFIAPALGLLVLLLVGGLIWAIGEDSSENPDNEIGTSKTPKETDDDTPRKTPSNDKTPDVTSSPTNSGEIPNTTQTPPTNGTTQTPVVSTEIEKVKQNATEFMRRIAQNDTNPFLKTDQAERVSQKIKNLKSSSGLAENLRAVGRDKSQFESLASTQNLKPQFLAAAALNEGGNPLETAKTMLPILGKLKIPLSNDFADDCLLIIAAYNQGKAGDFKTLQQKIEGFSKKLSKEGKSVSTRELRSIWFLKTNGKLTDAEFENAINFLAIGVIMVNPKEFGVNAEAVVF